MSRPAFLFAALASCLVSACAMPQQQAANQESLLATAGFTELPASTPERLAFLHSLPTNEVVRHVDGGTVAYVYADPRGCDCLYVGDQAAYARYRQEVLQSRPAGEQGGAVQGGWESGPWGPNL